MLDLEELVNDIEDSKEYLKYKEIGNIIENDKYIMDLLTEIKSLQHKALILEYNDDPKYLEIEEVIKKKVEILNSNSTYKLYLEKMKEYNNIIANTSDFLTGVCS